MEENYLIYKFRQTIILKYLENKVKYLYSIYYILKSKESLVRCSYHFKQQPHPPIKGSLKKKIKVSNSKLFPWFQKFWQSKKVKGEEEEP